MFYTYRNRELKLYIQLIWQRPIHLFLDCPTSVPRDICSSNQEWVPHEVGFLRGGLLAWFAGACPDERSLYLYIKRRVLLGVVSTTYHMQALKSLVTFFVLRKENLLRCRGSLRHWFQRQRYLFRVPRYQLDKWVDLLLWIDALRSILSIS